MSDKTWDWTAQDRVHWKESPSVFLLTRAGKDGLRDLLERIEVLEERVDRREQSGK